MGSSIVSVLYCSLVGAWSFTFDGVAVGSYVATLSVAYEKADSLIYTSQLESSDEDENVEPETPRRKRRKPDKLDKDYEMGDEDENVEPKTPQRKRRKPEMGESGDSSPALKKPIALAGLLESNKCEEDIADGSSSTPAAIDNKRSVGSKVVARDRNVGTEAAVLAAGPSSTPAVTDASKVVVNQMPDDETDDYLVSSLPPSSLHSSVDSLCKLFPGEYIHQAVSKMVKDTMMVSL